MTAIMSVDFEFTNQWPSFGEPMEMGAVIIGWDEQSVRPSGHRETIEINELFPVRSEIGEASQWVQVNQHELFSLCVSERNRETFEAKRDRIIESIRYASEKFGKIIPVAWDGASDMAYLGLILGKDNISLVHYSYIEISSLLFAVTKELNPDLDRIRKKLCFYDENQTQHRAIYDARFQLKLFLAIARDLRDTMCQVKT